MTMRTTRLVAVTVTLTALTWVPVPAGAQTAQARYEEAKERDDKVRAALAEVSPTASTAARAPIFTEARAVINAYERVVRAHRASGYADNALFNAATLADALHEKFGLTTDRDAALRLYRRLAKEYPTAPLVRESSSRISALEAIAEARAPIAPSALGAADSGAPAAPAQAAADTSAAPARPGKARLLAIERSLLPGIVRVTLQLDREVAYHEEKLSGPARVFFDLQGVDAAPELKDAVLRYPSDVVRQIRTGRHPDATRVVLDLEGVTTHSVYTLYNPFRIVIDADSKTAATTTTTTATTTTATTTTLATTPPPVTSSPLPASPKPAPSRARAASAPRPPATTELNEPLVVPSVVPAEEAPAPSAPAMEKTPEAAAADAANAATESEKPGAPKAPAVNGAGGFSIARQLGLGVSRIVIDPGHGGHDPGAQARGVNEADVTLDVALRLEKLLEKEPGLEVILTRRTDVYIPLEERTAIANREGADLFLSIHANTSRNTSARGVETYFLSFAGSADAEAVAARENSSHAGEMHKLPDIIRAITLNNKLDESRDFAGMVQEALVSRLRRSSKAVQNRGVKKAPFVVLIGAEMPSVLAEVSFMSNRNELQLLKTAAYKNRIAEALHAAVMRYRRSLKGSATAAIQ
jgi:N-acetylmuramoyl-L-alanine amidase